MGWIMSESRLEILLSQAYDREKTRVGEDMELSLYNTYLSKI